MFATSIIHPALWELHRYQVRARFSKMVACVRSPRRKLATFLGVLLAMVWLGQAVTSIFLREAAEPDQLAVWIPLGMFCYAFWHLLKTVARKPVEPFEWTPAEIELLHGAPISRLQLICFRLLAIFQAAVVKSLIFSLLMIPDLHFFAAGFVGMLTGLLLVDLIRLLFELICYGCSKRVLIGVRTLLFGTVAIWIGNSLWVCLTDVRSVEQLSSPAALLFAKHWLELLTEQLTTTGRFLLTPFEPATGLILASSVNAELFGKWTVASGLVIIASIAVMHVDARVLKLRRRREQLLLDRGKIEAGHRGETVRADWNVRPDRVRVPWRFNGTGSIAWRQLRGAYHYRGTLAISLGLPTALCCLPLLAHHNQYHMLINLVSGLIFYSFLLLPAALMLDFRRDIHRMDVLKSLPIGPLSVTIGQLAVPVALCSLFQATVLGIAAISGAISVWQMLMAAILLIPFSVFIFASENLVFMMAPYRRNQEGVMTFVRTILTFTAKGVFLVFVLIGVIGWAFASRQLSLIFPDPLLAQSTLFGTGIWIGTALAAAGITWKLTKLYERFDPSLDAPAIS